MKSLLNQQLKNYTTIGIGGMVHWMFFPTSDAEIVDVLRFCFADRVPFIFLAGGSNSVFPDVGLYSRQAVINLSEFAGIEILDDNNSGTKIAVDPGYPLQSLVDFAMTNNLGGVTGLNRVPGTVGGAVVGNAGAYGCEINSIVGKVEVLKLDEIQKQPDWVNVHILDNAQCNFGYRDSVFKQDKNLILTKVTLELKKAVDPKLEMKNYNEIAIKRDAVYPVGFLSPGSLFKNIYFSSLPAEIRTKIPPQWVVYGDKLPIGKILESLNVKGYRVGNIGMRATHANIMVNYGGGTYLEAITVVKNLQDMVKEKWEIDIEPEVRFMPADFREFWR